MKSVRRVERDLAKAYPSAEITTRSLAVVSAIGRDISGLGALSRGLDALSAEGLEPVAVAQGPRNVDIQFVLPRDVTDTAIRLLHRALVEKDTAAARVTQDAKAKAAAPQLAA
jgi:aspartate kinase